MKKTILIIICLFVVVAIVFFGRITEYLLSEFVYCRHGYKEFCTRCLDQKKGPRVPEPHLIPNHIHQIFFFETDDELPNKLQEAQLSWQRKHPGYGYTLWDKKKIDDLIQNRYPHLEDLYRSYGHWVRRADMARYLVMHQHGGWYVDIDIHCKHGLQNLSSTAVHQNKSLVVRWTEPAGCSNDFIGVTPKHPFFLHVLHGMFESNKWYVFPYATTMFSTGPMFMWGRMLNYPYQAEDVFWVYNHSMYFDLLHGSSWHSWDGKIVWHFFNHRSQLRVMSVIFFILFSGVALTAFYIRKKKRLASIDTFDRLFAKLSSVPLNNGTRKDSRKVCL